MSDPSPQDEYVDDALSVDLEPNWPGILKWLYANAVSDLPKGVQGVAILGGEETGMYAWTDKQVFKYFQRWSRTSEWGKIELLKRAFIYGVVKDGVLQIRGPGA